MKTNQKHKYDIGRLWSKIRLELCMWRTSN